MSRGLPPTIFCSFNAAFVDQSPWSRRLGGSSSTPPGGCGSAAASRASEMAAHKEYLIIESADRSRGEQKLAVPFHARRLRNYAQCPQGVKSFWNSMEQRADCGGAVAVCQGGLLCRRHPGVVSRHFFRERMLPKCAYWMRTRTLTRPAGWLR